MAHVLTDLKGVDRDSLAVDPLEKKNTALRGAVALETVLELFAALTKESASSD